MDKKTAAALIVDAKEQLGLSWADIATGLGTAPTWTVSALLGNHPVPPGIADKAAALLELDRDVSVALQRQPYRVADPDLLSDPTIYRFHEALNVYGPAIKELIHEEFGDGIMSAINFNLTVERRPMTVATGSASSSTASSSNTNGDSQSLTTGKVRLVAGVVVFGHPAGDMLARDRVHSGARRRHHASTARQQDDAEDGHQRAGSHQDVADQVNVDPCDLKVQRERQNRTDHN